MSRLLATLFLVGTSLSAQVVPGPGGAVSADPLPSWNDGLPKKAIVAFVGTVTTPGSPGFVPVSERIATFDNDGTLWSEQPLYFQLFFALDRVRALAPQHPERKETEPSRRFSGET